MGVSLKAIAEESGCSIASVSRALSHKGRLSDETRSRILEIAGKRKYRPNMLVSGLQTGRTKAVGILGVQDLFIKGIHDGLLAADHVPISLSALNASHAAKLGLSELDQIHRLVDRRVDGLLLCPIYEHGDEGYWKEALDYGIPIVAVDREMTAIKADFVGVDDEAGGRLAAEHLLSLGHRRLAHIAGPDFSSTAVGRRKGFEAALAGVEGVEYVCVVDESFNNSTAAAEGLLSSATRPTAIFTANDFQAARLLLVAARRGLRIPDDLSVVGFGDLEFSSFTIPPLTTMHQDFYVIGRTAATLVIDRADGKVQNEIRKIRLKPELVVRESTASVARNGVRAKGRTRIV